MNDTPFECSDNSQVKVQGWGGFGGVMRYCEKENKKNGLWEGWDNKIKSIQGEFQNNIAVGKWTVWHDNGIKYSETFYVSGKKTGEAIFWHDNGQVDSKGILKNNLRNGKWSFWDSNGSFISNVEFTLGIPVKEIAVAKKECPQYATLKGPLYYGSESGIGLSKLICESIANNTPKILWIRKYDKDGRLSN